LYAFSQHAGGSSLEPGQLTVMHCIAFGTTGGQGKFLLTPRDADLPFSFLFLPLLYAQSKPNAAL
jgi:hypothetical protein